MADLFDVIDLVGLVDARITQRFECYQGTSSIDRLPADFDVHGVNLIAHKPPTAPRA